MTKYLIPVSWAGECYNLMSVTGTGFERRQSQTTEAGDLVQDIECAQRGP